MEKEFKIGDKVKITGNRNYSGTPIGTIGTIYKTNKWGAIAIEFLNGTKLNDFEWIHKGDYKHYQEEIVLDVILEEEFVLPKNWYLKINQENINILNDWRHKLGIRTRSTNISDYDFITETGYGRSFTWLPKTSLEITFEQFKKYVLKEKPIFEPLPFFKILKKSFRGEITQVQNNEGNIFQIGDKIKGINGCAPRIESMIISEFRYNNAKTNICAVTQQFSDYGIGIDKIEHVLEFKKDEIVLDIIEPQLSENELIFEEAKKRYPIGTKFKVVHNNSRCTVLSHDNHKYMFVNGHINLLVEEIVGSCISATVYRNGNWAEIISKPEEIVLDIIEDKIPENESNLDKAKRLYPIGTKYKEYRGTIYTVEHQSFREFNDSMVYGENNKGCLLYEGKWAEIVSKPEVKEEPVIVTSSLQDMLALQNEGVKRIVTVQSEKKETLLEKAERLFPIGTKFKALGLTYLYQKGTIMVVTTKPRINTANGRIIVNVNESGIAQAVISKDGSQVAEILYNGYRIGETFSKNRKIIRLETINGQGVAFFENEDGFFGPNYRILTKNIKK